MNKYSVFKRIDAFGIFDQFVDDYEDKKILDFGGNRGNLLWYSQGKIQEENYTCLDISKEALNTLLEDHPNAGTVYWNRYHETYNPHGNKNENFPKLKQFDIAFANSVFTHHELNEMLYCIEQLCHVSKQVCFTYIDPLNKKIFDILKSKHAIDIQNIEEIQDKKLSYITSKDKVMWTAINTEYLKELIKKYSNYDLYIEHGLTDGFNYMKVDVNHRTLIPGIFGY